MTVQEWLGKDNTFGEQIFTKKYQYNNETLDEWFDRVSSGNSELRRIIKDKLFLFGGRALSNLNTGNNSSFFNCYSKGFVQDNLSDIMQANTDIALTYKAQGGQGLSLSKLRPKGTPIGKQYSSDGIIPFMKMYNETTSTISQGGSRKGALMISLDCRHKEAEEFIKIKSNDTEIKKANLSLEVDDGFMQAVQTYYETGEEIILHEVREYGEHKIEYDVCPIKIYKLMCQTCYEWAEPAMLYTERFRNYNLMEFVEDYKIETSNPCVTGDTEILTSIGYRKIKDTIGETISIWNGYKFSEVTPRVTGKNEKILKIKFSNGCELRCTPYHKFILKNSERVEARNLSIGDSLIKCEFPIVCGETPLQNAYTQGFFSGDGFVCKDRNAKYISFYGENKRKLVKYCSIISQREFSDIRETYSVNAPFDKDFVPSFEYNLQSKCEWLSGLVDSDGGSSPDGSITVTSVNYDFLRNTQMMLNTLGIGCTMQKCKDACDKLMPNGEDKKEYHCQDLFRLTIASSDVVQLNKIGFSPKRVKNYSAPDRNAKRFIKITSIEEQEELEDFVYCFTESDNHSGIFNGVITSQCGEQPLPKDFCCNLGSINLAELVKNKFTDTSEFDFKEFKNVIRISVTALDDIIDKNLPFHALPQQAENSKNYRNIGLGVFGYADMLMMLKLKYGSDEAIEFTEKLFKFLFVEAVLASNSLAKEKGTFPKYEETLFSSSIIKKHFTEKQISELKKDGLRNCSLISIAPTGSISNLLGRSGGCEPEYAISYKRKTESLNNGEDKYFDIYCQTAKEYISEFGENLPDYFICSNDIPYKTRIITQGIMQNSVDTAISSTVNLPKSTTLKQVEDLYLLAWQYGLKGVTIFRDGCKKTGIISTATKKEEPEKQKFDYIEPISKDTIGETYGTNVKKRIACGKLYLNICRDKDGNLAEMFVNTGKGGICQSNINAISRLVSISLRSGIKVEEIAEQLRGIICPACTKVMTKGEKLSGASCPDVIARTLLEEYNKEEIIIRKPKRGKAKTKEILPVEEFDASMICPDCGAKLHMDGGCNICVGDETHIGCGYTKCG